VKRKPNPKLPAALPEQFVEVEFVYDSPTAKEVYLAGDFNNWSANGLPMRKTEDGDWRIRVPLSPGCHEFRYIVDGEWKCDPRLRDYVPNPFGSCNCVVKVTRTKG